MRIVAVGEARGVGSLLARDEAHRLANSFQGSLHRRATIGSALDGVPGIGPKLRRALLTRLGSLAEVRAATAEQLAAVPGIGPALARRIREALAGDGAAPAG